MGLIASIIMTVVSFAIQMIQARNQRARAKKAQKEAEDKADAAKGLSVTTELNPIALSLIYGRFKAGGVRTWHAVSNDSGNETVVAGGVQIGTFNVQTTGTKNEFLKYQQAICIGGFSNCYGADIDEQPAGTFGGYYNIHVYPFGGVADNQGAPTDFTFNDIGYLGACFKINRDDPQFNGIPSVVVYGDGKPVPAVVTDGTNYSVSSTKSYSNNSARVLLDYLLSPFGRNLSADDLDLESFARAQELCDKVMIYGQGLSGRYWTERGGNRDIKRFECNTAISTSDEIRSNVEKILESMDMAELIWSGGKYKLQLWYPTEYGPGLTYQAGDIVQTIDGSYYNLYKALGANNTDPRVDKLYWTTACSAYITDDHIQRGKEITISWPNAQSRFNSVSVRFLNESKDFVEDTVVWPIEGSTLANTYLAEDGGVQLVGDFFEDTITDYWHALARAEHRCRQSRIAAIYKFTVSPALSLLEPGDIVHIDSETINIVGQLAMVSEVKVSADGSLDLEAVRYDARTLAWNANDYEDVTMPPMQDTNIGQARNLVFDTYTPTFVGCVGTLRWDMPDDDRVTRYLVKGTNIYAHNIQSDTEWFDIGETTATWFDIPSLASGIYTFTVVAASSNRIAPKNDQFTGSHWPAVSAGLAAISVDGVTYANVNVYTRSASVPATPTGGVFDFAYPGLVTIPVGWSGSIPSGSAAVWLSRAIAQTAGHTTVDNTLEWTAPIALSINPTYVIAEPSAVICMQDEFGNNFNFVNCKGKLFAFFNDVDISATNQVVYSIREQVNCVASIVSTPGFHQGEWKIDSLTGNKGSITVNAHFDGLDWPVSIAIIALKEGYAPDPTPPPQAATPLLTAAFSHIIAELTVVPTYTEGHGHHATNVYVAKHNKGTPGIYPTFDDAVLITNFTNEVVAIPTDTASAYTVWFQYVTVDGVAGPVSIPAIATTGVNVGDVLDALEGQIRSSSLNTALRSEVDAVASQYTVKVAGSDGRMIAGFGLGTEPAVDDEGTEYESSLFAVLATRFFIGNPGMVGEIPFIVITAPYMAPGDTYTYEPGVYMRRAFIQDAQVTNAKIANLAVDSAKIANATIVTAKIADAAITNAKIADATITSAKIANANITNAKIADAAISNAKIQNAAIDSAKIADAAITNTKIANASITSAKIQDASINNAHIVDAAITNAKIGNLAVDTIKIAGNAVTIPVSAFGYAESVNTYAFDGGGSPVTVTVAASCRVNPSGVSYLNIYRDGGLIYQQVTVATWPAECAHSAVFIDYPGAGYHYYTAQVSPSSGSLSNPRVGIMLLVCKR